MGRWFIEGNILIDILFYPDQPVKKLLLILFICLIGLTWSCYIQKENRGAGNKLGQSITKVPDETSFSIIDPGSPQNGNADQGYNYLVSGNAFNTGIPFEFYKLLYGLKYSKFAKLAGYNQFSLNDFVIFKNEKGRLTVTPGCLHCHAQQFNGKLVVGLGNSYSNFYRNTRPYMEILKKAFLLRYGKNSDEWKMAERSFEVEKILASQIMTEVQGPTPAQKIAEVMASHRDPVTLVFRPDTVYFKTPGLVIPEDVPALWISKKRKALTVNAMRQGDVLKHIVSTSMLTLKDTAEAKEIYEHVKDVWAFIKQLEPPSYPFPINQDLAANGKKIFVEKCARCHGNYGGNNYYPNKIIAPAVIGTDSLMWKYFIAYPEYENWYNNSWFANPPSPSYVKAQVGYVPPPLDGVWITAPYLHNGSVPTIEDLLNSKSRPRYWKRNFNKEEYDYKNLGWKYKRLAKPGDRQTYNTEIPGYGNYGHNFGDQLTEKERLALIEYLKTL